ncbi:Ankyrin repeat-containing domain protein [Naviculisporaceae sp. PSN 640]
MSELSVQPKKPSVKVSPLRQLDRPDIQSLMDNKTKARESLADRRNPDSCLQGSNSTPLHRPLNRKNNAAVVALVLAGSSLSTRILEGRTPRIRASEQAFRYETIKLMCELGADVNAKGTSDGDTALHWTCDNPGSERVIMALVSHGADLESRITTDGCHTPPYFAVRQKNLEAARKLLDYGADPNAVSSRGFTPLYMALDLDPGTTVLDFVRLLCQRRADTTHIAVYKEKPFTPLTWALRSQSTSSIEVLRTLLGSGADNSGTNPEVNFTPLDLALESNPSVVPFLIEMGASSSDGVTPVIAALHSLNFDALMLLVELGADLEQPTAEPAGPSRAQAMTYGPEIAREMGKSDLVQLFESWK